MENQNNLKKPLLSESVDPSSCHQKDVAKKKKLNRSRSAPLIVSLPGDFPTVDHEPNLTSESLFKRLHPSFKKITMYLSFYLLTGGVCFYIVRDQVSGKKTSNSIIDSLYFCMVTMTTVGYGDLVPQSALAKVLACAFVFLGMALVGLVLSHGADYLVEKQQALLIRALQMRKRFQPSDVMKEIESGKVRYKCVVVALILFVLIISGIVFLIFVEKLDALDALYCVCVTMTSLGYGDFSFSTEGGRAFAVLWILMSTICLGQFFLYLAELNTESSQNALIKWVLTRRVTIVDLGAADMDNDGVVDAAEFVLYKLKEMGKITQNDISLVMKGFEELDVDQSGTLSVYDLQQLAS
ncbi:two-pore potassium channel 1-like [Chenopodium quinoa]|uniref:two-pore potassium channel 1-like n=1 Tax=Chenopodium quinoa TaxID=63459 RepID=UPI000B790036|nr:two-pore potassium channel 1-like [Chenopodium quinoa]XP_021771370.1 two-pore potassium channel 1-like [Chenopodium quinoa]XP_021771371.1 two-pore potassium channel 1-like [Chenopodium quinoa]XP_021771372.1 two-pore potassium channel 1-like [Chenopodium quinoa]XP_021771373.1 two-pore potassium channel 1-like [Chenopodium quinoa]XP_021771374.1 two-pore potassium channel 1-like [Chenopodium quinoa]XP_021771375.1 two-pore potassium channel 1-like [Chenopodium quinoa]